MGEEPAAEPGGMKFRLPRPWSSASRRQSDEDSWERGWGGSAMGVPPSKRGLFLLGLTSMVLGGFALWSWFVFDGIPARESLSRATGTFNWARLSQSSRSSSLRFGLKGSSLSFYYPSNGGRMNQINETLTREDCPVIEVLYDSRASFTPWFSNEKYYPVYELTANGEIIRSHADIGAEWASNQVYGLLLGIAFLPMGVFLMFIGWV
jgi:hypothetical protein